MQVTILLSAALLGDKLNMVKLAAASLMVSGVVLVCKPPFVFNPSQTQVKCVLRSLMSNLQKL